MALEGSLKRLCTPAVLSRGRRLAEHGDKIHRRRCRYEGDETVLDARVDSSDSWDGPHRPQVVLDEDGGEITYFECDCHAARGSNRPCKHAAALALDFVERPDAYAGYDAAGHLRTSRAVARLMERVASAEPSVAGSSTEGAGGTVDLELTLTYEAGFGARFRLVGSQGAYVLKSISDFVSMVESGSFCSYGRRLAFVHTERAFSRHGWQVADFLVRAVRNRRAYAFDRAVGAGPLGSNGAPQREMHLSSVELWDLLGIYADREVTLEDRSAPTDEERAARRLVVVERDPELRFAIEPLGEGAYQIVRESDVRLVALGGRVLAWDEALLCCCSQSVSRKVAMLDDLLSPMADKLVVAERDLPVFAATVLPLLESAGHTEVPAELESLRPEPCELQFYLDRDGQGVTCEGFATYGSTRVSLQEARPESGDVTRDAKLEAQGRSMLRRYFSARDDGVLCIGNDDADAMASFVLDGVAELQRLGTVYATDAYDRLKSKVRPKPRMELSVRSNLLDLRLDVEGMTAQEFAELLESHRLRKRYHRLRDGSFVDLADVDLAQTQAVVDALGLTSQDVGAGVATVPAYRALLLEEGVGPAFRDASLEDYLGAIREIDRSSYVPPADLAEVLRPYQREGFGWMSALVDQGLAGILADEMGLGKSLQLICLLSARCEEARATGPSLIVCPASLVYNWKQEFDKFAPALEVRVVVGRAEERDCLRTKPADVLVTSYDLLRRDVAAYEAMQLWLVALDEAQYIKNRDTMAARAVKRLDCLHRFALTGTPVENRLSELWSIFDFLMPGLLGSYEGFRERFERPISEEGDADRAQRLSRALSPFVLRRTKREVLSDLPDKLEQVVYARMDPEQRVLYDAQVSEVRARLDEQMQERTGGHGGQGRIQILAALTRLRQTCCDPRLVFEDYEGPSCKVDTILTLVGRAADAGERLLVFSQFTSFLDILAHRLEQKGISHFMLTGSTPKRRRIELVERFNAGGADAFLISLKAGGTGLNLTGASVVIHADPWWNAAAQDQASDRAHRMGQTRDVTVYKVICANTLEERIQDMQRRKSALASQVVGATGTGTLSIAELSELLADVDV